MGLTLVTGRANTGKTGILYGVLRDAAAAGSPVTLLLPTMPDVRRAEEELGRRGVVGAKLAVLDSWIEELWALHGDGRRVIRPGARRVLLGQALAAEKLDALKASGASPGFTRLLSEVVTRLTDVPQRGTGVPDKGTATDAEIVAVLRRYHDLAAAEGLIEPIAAAMLLAGDPPRVEGPVLVNRFTDLSPAQEAFIVGLAVLGDVTLALTWEPDLPATAALDPLVERLLTVADVVPQVAPPGSTELERLEERLYCPGDPVGAEGRVRTGLAAGDEAECALAARSARKLVDDGMRPERVAVVFRHVGKRLGLLRAAFASEELGADFDVALPAASTPFGCALSALIGSCADPLRERLLSLLLSPYSDADPSAVSELDIRWRRYRVAGERLLREASELGPLTAFAIAAGRRAAQGLDEATARAWRAAADALMASAWERRRSGGEVLDGGAHRALLSVVADATSVRGSRLSASDVLQLLSETSVTAGPAEREGFVQVTEVHRLRSRRFDAVVLGGLTAEEFSAERPQPLALEIAERLGAPRGMLEREAERMLFYLVATRAREALVLLRQESDARGEAKRPSVFWDEVADLYAGDMDGPAEESALPPGVLVERLGLHELADAAPAYAPGRRQAREAAASGEVSLRGRGTLTDATVLAALASTTEFSVTELETYLGCPYRWFYERAVQPREVDSEVDARERGSRAHRLLAAFYSELETELGMRRVSPERLDDALALFERVAARTGEEAAVQAVGLREELSLAQAERWVRAVVEDDAELLPGFEPIAHEFAFGEAAGQPFSLGGVSLRGSVDRIDAGTRGLVITDYKSDRRPKGHASFAKSGTIQLPVYAAAASALLGKPVVAGHYRSLRSLQMRGFRLADVDVGGRGVGKDEVDAEALEAIIADASAAVSRAAAGIRAGRIEQTPLNRGGCAWCGASSFCEEAR